MNGIQNCLLLWVHLYLINFSRIAGNCRGNGLVNCACNFIGACTYDASIRKFNPFTGTARDLRRYIPNVTPLAMTWPLTQSQITEICEPGEIGIIYDCKNRIPLMATIVMTADQYRDLGYRRPPSNFRQSSNIANPDLQQNDDDYNDASNRIFCYESFNGNHYIDSKWYQAKRTQAIAPLTACQNAGAPRKSPVHRGHLVAASYGRGPPNLIRSVQTFVYTNAVPQFAGLNSGRWRIYESNLIKWANDNCGSSPLHVIVGCIPSTYPGNEQRFFGKSGFSDFIGPSRLFPGGYEYRVNVPSYLWTAACCDLPSSRITRSTTFFAENLPRGFSRQSVELSNLFSAIGAHDIDLFPGMDSCNDDNNFVSIY
ncbi:uncharacterized protein LOC114530013 [Dendronephthya gigantea]|uniref:uncharacterized protein LOC114530013 n=1 Tax=Dendronephthya gigantea TaxID=151771 RepID=UPI001069EC69|nr:uncharacterized protein LOC114530013 [Dendronephthya gigantea]